MILIHSQNVFHLGPKRQIYLVLGCIDTFIIHFCSWLLCVCALNFYLVLYL